VAVSALSKVVSKFILIWIPFEVLAVGTLGDLAFFSYKQVTSLG